MPEEYNIHDTCNNNKKLYVHLVFDKMSRTKTREENEQLDPISHLKVKYAVDHTQYLLTIMINLLSLVVPILR